MAGNEALLRMQLKKSLGWDEDFLQDIFGSITSASSMSDVEDVIVNLMDGNAAARKAIEVYIAGKSGGPGKPSAAQMVSPPQASGSSASRGGGRGGGGQSASPGGPRPVARPASSYVIGLTPAAAANNNSSSGSKQDGGDSGGSPRTRGGGGGGGGGDVGSPGEGGSATATAAGLAAMQAANGKVLGIFKQGGRINKAAGKGGSKDGPAGGGGPVSLAAAAGLERQVCNCLACGKVYDCRNLTKTDIVRFLERKGVCSFCGAQVRLSYRNTQQPSAAAAGGESQPGDAAVTLEAEAVDTMSAADKAAEAFKNRLVQYDRESAKRTTVIDDQSDFFEVDNNNWLTDEERTRLKEQRRLEEEAEQKRKRLAITIDLLGRRVIRADASLVGDDGVAAFVSDAETRPVAYDPKQGSHTLWMEQDTDKKVRQAGSSGSSATAVAKDCGTAGGGGVGVAGQDDGLSIEESVRKAADELRSLRATANPTVLSKGSAPTFSKSAAKAVTAGHHKQQHNEAGKAGSTQSKPGSSSKAVAADGSSSKKGYSRLQHDVAEVFEDFGAQIMYSDVEAAVIARDQAKPFDLCPPEYKHLPPLSPTGPLPVVRGLVTEPSQLPPGLVLLRGFLERDCQENIINKCRGLGLGPGGFYTPTYTQGQTLNLKMMCLGQHWEPRTARYEAVRSSYDGATPPELPPYFRQLCSKALQAAQEVAKRDQGATIPDLTPDICLVNFYEPKTGRLGMHQDKDESSSSLRQGLPVVSFSLGDTADFKFSTKFCDESQAQTVRLVSGDVLVFGGPARMIYHSVSYIHQGTTPPDLVQRTGLRPGRLNLTFRQS